MEKIIEWINGGYLHEAEKEFRNIDLNRVDKIDELAILGAEIYLGLGNLENAFSYISVGLKANPKNYELYFMLGRYYDAQNKMQAALCFEMASYYAKGTEDELYLEEFRRQYENENHVCPVPVSIVIVSYNSADITKKCIKSIRENHPADSYELVIVDNHSTDGILEWLRQQKDLKLICNDTNTGFAHACNQGAKAAEKGNDIFFLNNDTRVPCNAIFWLRMGLYEKDNVGAVGSITNNAGNGQCVFEDIHTVGDWIAYGEKRNIPMANPYEKKLWLIGYALLIKRNVLDKVGLFDERFGKGNYEDNDLGIRIMQAGYELRLCHNSFIFHYGSMGFKQNDPKEYEILMEENRRKLADKWGFDITEYANEQEKLLSLIMIK